MYEPARQRNGEVLQELKALGHSSCYHWCSRLQSLLLSSALCNKPNTCERLQQKGIINKIHSTFDVMDASSLPFVLTSSLVVTLAAVIHPDQQ